MEELKVGMKAIIVNSQNHTDYNFRICEIKEICNSRKNEIYVELHGYGVVTNFYVRRNEIIPLVYENTEDLRKSGLTIDDMAALFTEYKGYYDLICRVADDISRESEEKEKKYKKQIDEKNCQIEEMKHKLDCLKADKEELRTRCKESARDNFDNHLYGLLNIVGAEDLCKEKEFPPEPIKVAEMLIDATKRRVNCMTGKEYDKPVYEKWQLERIARHLLVYCGK